MTTNCFNPALNSSPLREAPQSKLLRIKRDVLTLPEMGELSPRAHSVYRTLTAYHRRMVCVLPLRSTQCSSECEANEVE